MNDQNGRVAVITGAGGGLGVHIAHRFAADGYTTVLVGRTESTLRQLSRAVRTGVTCTRGSAMSPTWPPSRRS